MDTKLLLVKMIMLLYKESTATAITQNSVDLIKDLLSQIRLPEAMIDTDSGREVLVGLISTVNDMCEHESSHVFDRTSLLQRIKINVASESYLYPIIEEGLIEDVTDPDALLQQCLDYRRFLKTYLAKNKIKNIVKEAGTKLAFKEETVDWKTFVGTLIEQLEPYTHDIARRVESTDSSDVDISDVAGMTNMITKGRDATSNDGILRTGWQGVNKMTGDHGGLRRGDMVLIGALQHNYKSGMTLNLGKQIALYNQPYMLDVKKKPLIIYLSLENNTQDTILSIYKNLMENETKTPCDITMVTPDEAAAYVYARLSINGYHFKLLRRDPSNFTYTDLFTMVDQYIADGYEVHALLIDYLAMMSRAGCSGGNDAQQIRDLFRRVRNYTNPKLITCVTPHQLSPDAKQLLRNGTPSLVKAVANKGYYDSCKAIDQEVDLEIAIHIEKPGDGFSYLTMMRGKHRRSGMITPERDLYCVYKFEEAGEIPDDVLYTSAARHSVGGSTEAEGGDKPWWG